MSTRMEMNVNDVLETTELANGKANFDEIYNADDPRAYFEELGSLGYVIPHHGQQVFPEIFAAQAKQRGVETPGVLDLCCSYGVNAALLKCDLTLDEIEERYRDPEIAELEPDELAARDREFFARHSRDDAPKTFGLDISDRAIDYAIRVGLLDDGAAENLETESASSDMAEIVDETDVITVTGGIGYISAKTVSNLYKKVDGDLPWLASFSLRQYSYNDIADELAERGMVTERLAGTTFIQRSFSCDEEQDHTLNHLESAGLDVSGREADGDFHTEFFLSRPAEEAAELPLSEILPSAPGGVQLG